MQLLSGEIVSINEELTNSPELINSAPYDSWFFKIKPSAIQELNDLLDASSYRSSIGE